MIATALPLKRGEARRDTDLAPDAGARALGSQMADVPGAVILGAAVVGGAVPADVARAELFRVICLR